MARMQESCHMCVLVWPRARDLNILSSLDQMKQAGAACVGYFGAQEFSWMSIPNPLGWIRIIQHILHIKKVDGTHLYADDVT